MLIVAVLYGLLLACIVQPDYEGFMAAALMINFLVPPVLLIINIAAACFRKSTWSFPNKRILRNNLCLPACKEKNIAIKPEYYINVLVALLR